MLNFPIVYDFYFKRYSDSEQSTLNLTEEIIQVCEMTNTAENIFAYVIGSCKLFELSESL